MRKKIKITAGWIHATLILALLPPVIYAVGAEQNAETSGTLYFRCLLIALPVVATGVAIEKCRGLSVYLLVCAVTFAATWGLGWAAAGILHQNGDAFGYLFLLLAETLFVAGRRMAARLHEKREEEARKRDEPIAALYSDLLKEPSFLMLLYFGVAYVLALNVNSPEVCNAAFFSAPVYGAAVLLYRYVDKTENYLSLNRRTCNLPSRRIYGIGNGMLAIFLLLLMIAVLPSVFMISGRTYRDVRNGFENWNLYGGTAAGTPDMTGGAEMLPDWVREAGEPKSAPVWVNALFYALGAGILLLLAAVLVKMVFDMFREFRGAGDENGDVVEELKDADTESEIRLEVPKRRNGRQLSERERIRRQYRRFIRKHRKERPAAYESPAEIEAAAGIAQSEEGKEMHGRYEYARYGAGTE